jgi:hypothetical protein
VETRQYFLRKLKEEGIIKVIWTPDKLNSSDLYMKNLACADFEKTYQGVCWRRHVHERLIVLGCNTPNMGGC